MSEKRYYRIIVEEGDFRKLLWEKYIHDNRKPKKKRLFESPVDFNLRKFEWEQKDKEMVNEVVLMYKKYFPEIYDDFELNNFGFTAGHHKTYYLYISKYMPEDYEEHA